VPGKSCPKWPQAKAGGQDDAKANSPKKDTPPHPPTPSRNIPKPIPTMVVSRSRSKSRNNASLCLTIFIFRTRDIFVSFVLCLLPQSTSICVSSHVVVSVVVRLVLMASPRFVGLRILGICSYHPSTPPLPVTSNECISSCLQIARRELRSKRPGQTRPMMIVSRERQAEPSQAKSSTPFLPVSMYLCIWKRVLRCGVRTRVRWYASTRLYKRRHEF